MIFTDGVHLMSDTSLDELHEFATKRLGFKRSWFQENKPSWAPHYDLTTNKAKKRALEAGAKLLPLREFIERMKSTPWYLTWKAQREGLVK
jgi:hypothetical protein